MLGKPLGKISKEQAAKIRADLHGLADHPGYRRFEEYFTKRLHELRGTVQPVRSNDFEALNRHNRPLHQAEAIEEVLQWVQGAMDQCDGAIEGETK
jgi:hypothetical protein